MATFKNPVLFSTHFGISPDLLKKAGLIDTFLTVDTPLFIDPILLDKCEIEKIRVDGYASFRDSFNNVVRLLELSQREGDAPWRGAQRQFSLREPPENGLGYGSGDRAGTSRPEEVRDTILRTAKEIITLGARDPEMISLMGFFEENVGPDTISDFTTRAIAPQLAEVTRDFCNAVGIPVKTSQVSLGYELPHYIGGNQRERAILLVPDDIVRELPVAHDWAGISAAAEANAAIRSRVNALLARIVKPTIADRKAALRDAALQSGVLFQALIASVKATATGYDQNNDVFGYYALKDILNNNLDKFASSEKFDLSKGISEIKRLVHATISMFKHHVENGNLWEELWSNGKPKKERAAQLIYYAISDCFCRANNVDISPEANMGGGPIDFKFSIGYNARVLVEMKRSNGTVVHGYEKQLEIYKEASRTNHGIFVVMDYGDLGVKLERIQEIRRERLAAGEPASDIVVIDATEKVSASKRK